MPEQKEENRLREKTNLMICDENELKNPIFTNVIDEDLSRKKIRAVMNIISKALISTLGPDGSTTILQGRTKDHLVTKDGLDVVSKIAFQDEVSTTILDLVKQISMSQVQQVGDGSTSAIVVANALLQGLTDKKNDIIRKVSPKVVTDMLNMISSYLEDELKHSATQISPDMHELEYISAIAMNNDDEGGKTMADIYKKIGKYGFITTDTKEKYEQDFVEYKRGVSWQRGYIDPCFGENYDGQVVIVDHPKVFITDKDITYDDCEKLYSQMIGMICGKQRQELVIIAPNIDSEARAFFRTNRQINKLGHPELKFTVVDIDNTTTRSINTLDDIALLCGCEVMKQASTQLGDVVARLDPAYLDKINGTNIYIGTAAVKATISKISTEIICDDQLLTKEFADKKVKALADIQKKLDDIAAKSVKTGDDARNEYFLKYRLSNLENKTAIFHVGGKTSTERESRERLIEDAIFAAKSALQYGYIVGGNIMIPRILHRNKGKIIELLKSKFAFLAWDNSQFNQDEFYNDFIQMIETGFLESYRAVLDNSYLTDDQI
jgi:chaperonin GroEL